MLFQVQENDQTGELLNRNCLCRFPATFTFVLRAFATLEGIGRALDANYKFVAVAQPYATQLLDLQVGHAPPVFTVQSTWTPTPHGIDTVPLVHSLLLLANVMPSVHRYAATARWRYRTLLHV